MSAAASLMATDLIGGAAGISLRNPVMLAAGTCGTLHEFGEVIDLGRIGGVVSKSITPLPREGNPVWRILDSKAGMLNAIGLANPGIEAFVEHYLPKAAGVADRGCAVFCSVAGFSVEDYVQVAAVLDEWGRGSDGATERRSDEGGRKKSDEGRESAGPDGTRGAGGVPFPVVSAIELNISCPNVKTGTEFCHSAAATREVVTAVRGVVKRLKMFVKLAPVGGEIPMVARAAIEAGADGLTVSNTIPAMAIDVRTRRPRLANVTGGLSGPALHPVAVRLVHELYTKVCRDATGRDGRAGVPIIGAGGVMTWEDAAEFILAGATAVEMGTALFVDPRSPLKVVKGLEKWVRSQGCANVSELVGAVSV